MLISCWTLADRPHFDNRKQLNWQDFPGLIEATTAFESISLSKLKTRITEVTLKMPIFVLPVPDISDRTRTHAPPPRPPPPPPPGPSGNFGSFPSSNVFPQMHGYNSPNTLSPPVFGDSRVFGMGFNNNFGHPGLANSGMGFFPNVGVPYLNAPMGSYPNMGTQFVAGGGMMGQPLNFDHPHNASGFDIDEVNAFHSRLYTPAKPSVSAPADKSVEEHTDESVDEHTDGSVDEHTEEPADEHADPIKALPKRTSNILTDWLLKKPAKESVKAPSVNIRADKRTVLDLHDTDDSEDEPLNEVKRAKASDPQNQSNNGLPFPQQRSRDPSFRSDFIPSVVYQHHTLTITSRNLMQDKFRSLSTFVHANSPYCPAFKPDSTYHERSIIAVKAGFEQLRNGEDPADYVPDLSNMCDFDCIDILRNLPLKDSLKIFVDEYSQRKQVKARNIAKAEAVGSAAVNPYLLDKDYHASHACHHAACVFPPHIILEHKDINYDRNGDRKLAQWSGKGNIHPFELFCSTAKHQKKPCHMGNAAQTVPEQFTMQLLASKDCASFTELTDKDLRDWETMPSSYLDSRLRTYILEVFNGVQYIVPVWQNTAREILRALETKRSLPSAPTIAVASTPKGRNNETIVVVDSSPPEGDPLGLVDEQEDPRAKGQSNDGPSVDDDDPFTNLQPFQPRITRNTARRVQDRGGQAAVDIYDRKVTALRQELTTFRHTYKPRERVEEYRDDDEAVKLQERSLELYWESPEFTEHFRRNSQWTGRQGEKFICELCKGNLYVKILRVRHDSDGYVGKGATLIIKHWAGHKAQLSDRVLAKFIIRMTELYPNLSMISPFSICPFRPLSPFPGLTVS